MIMSQEPYQVHASLSQQRDPQALDMSGSFSTSDLGWQMAVKPSDSEKLSPVSFSKKFDS